MKAIPFSVPSTQTASFRVQVDDVPHFYDRLHHHPEIQITLVEKGEGSLFVGDSISSFAPGDLLMIGAGVPHAFRNDAAYYTAESPGAYAVSLLFETHALGRDFFELPEMQHIQKLIQGAAAGLKFSVGITKVLRSRMHQMIAADGFGRLRTLLDILHALAQAKGVEKLSTYHLSTAPISAEYNRLNAVFQYCMDHYAEPIRLEEVAALSNLSVSAFCRYFKLHTRKTFSYFLNELRVGMACKLLSSGESTVAEICYQVGYNNLSNFNRQFKRIKGMTPTVYLKKIVL